MLCGGFPCQTFIIAGKRRGFEDTRGTLFFEIARIIEIKRPEIIVLENVKGLLNHNKGETFQVIIQTLSELGYDIQWMVLNSKFFGVPQSRERVFIIGNLGKKSKSEIFPFRQDCRENDKISTDENETSPTINATYARNQSDAPYIKVIGNLESDGWEKRNESSRRIYSPEGISPTIPTVTGGGHQPKIAIPVLTPNREEKRQNGRRFKENEDPMFTLTGQDIHGDTVDNFRIRRLTPLEFERLQGFPDGWTAVFSDVRRYKMMGNAVTVNVIKYLTEKIWSSITQ